MPLGPVLNSLVGAIPSVLSVLGNTIGGFVGANQQAGHNMELAKYQNAYNREMVREQRAYDSPQAQMKRLIAAGLNPNLVYGQGSSVAGSSASAMRSADVKPADYQSILSGLGTQIAQARLMNSQANLTDQKTEESTVKQDLMRSQNNLVKANPYMKKEYVDSLVLQLQSTAKIKEQEMQFLTIGQVEAGNFRGTAGFVKMQMEIEQLSQRLGLNTADQKIKAQILQSKEFQNAILEVQKKWMTEKEITPQHIYQGIMLLLSKMM